jgi:hypothetical protein
VRYDTSATGGGAGGPANVAVPAAPDTPLSLVNDI